MDYKYAARRFSKRLSLVSHVAAGTIAVHGIFTSAWGNDLAAAVFWLAVQIGVFFLDAYAGEPPVNGASP